MNGHMLDTNVFNCLANGELPLDFFSGQRLFATHVQLDELTATSDALRREKLLAIFEKVDAAIAATSTFIIGDSRIGYARLAGDDNAYDKMLTRLEELDRRSGKRAKGFNQSRDVRIAETAIRRGLALITNDENLRVVAQEFGGRALSLDELHAAGGEPRLRASSSMPADPSPGKYEVIGSFDELLHRLQELPAKLVGVEGFCGSGKSFLAEAVASTMPSTTIHLDNFVVGDDEARPYAERIDYKGLRMSVDGAAARRELVLIEGICLRSVLERLDRQVNLFVYVKRMSPTGLWHDGIHLEDAESADSIGILDEPERSDFSYHSIVRPHELADIVYCRVE